MTKTQVAYTAFCKTRFPLPSEAEVLDLELALGISFPPDYRQYLLNFNGGYFNDPEILAPNQNCPEDALTVMAGIHATDPSAELGKPGGFSPAIFDDNVPPQILPIGYTLMGNLLFLVTDPCGDDYGCIRLKIASGDESFFLAKGTEEFFGLLKRRGR